MTLKGVIDRQVVNLNQFVLLDIDEGVQCRHRAVQVCVVEPSAQCRRRISGVMNLNFLGLDAVGIGAPQQPGIDQPGAQQQQKYVQCHQGCDLRHL